MKFTHPSRLPDWQARYAALCAVRAAIPFEWGQHDCCLWAADAVQAMTGFDFAAAHRGTYADAAGAARLLHSLGGLRGLACAALGHAIDPRLAAVGDVVLLQHGGRELLAVCNGADAMAPGSMGLQVVGMDAALAAWRV